MNPTSTSANRLIATAVALLLGLVVIGGSFALAGASTADYEASQDDSTTTTTTTTEPAPAVEAEAVIAAPAPIVEEAASTPVPVEQTPEIAAEDSDCEAFFAELDAEHEAANQELAEVLTRFGVSFEILEWDDGTTAVDYDYSDPITSAIVHSFWHEKSLEDDTDWDHPCFTGFEGCEGEEHDLGDEDFEMSEEERLLLAESISVENELLAAAFTEAGIAFEWETDEYFEIDVIVWDYSDDNAIEVFSEVMAELYPEFASDFEHEDIGEIDEDYWAEQEALKVENNETLRALAAALTEAGVENTLDDSFEWVNLLFDLDDERAVAVVSSLR